MIELIMKDESKKGFIEDINFYDQTSAIFVCERRNNASCQSILIRIGSTFFWNNFYLKDSAVRTTYYNLQAALESRITKGYRVFLLNNKTELKKFLETK